LPIMAGFIILSVPITSIIYEHGKLDENGVAVVSGALKFYSIGMIGLAVNEIISKTFFSMQDSKTPMITAVLSMIFNIVMAYILFGTMKTNGLALAVALGSIFNAILNFILLYRKDNNLFNKNDFVDIYKIVISTFVMAAVVIVIYNFMHTQNRTTFNQIVTALVCAGGGAAVYCVMLYITKEELISKLIRKGD